MKHTLLSLLTLICLSGNAFSQTTYYVSSSGSNVNDGRSIESPMATIQHAIHTASDGDIIEVGTGTYSETLTIEKALTINGAEGTIVTPPSSPVPNKAILGPLVSVVRDYAIRKSEPEQSGSGRVTITGIEFDCGFHPEIMVGIYSNWDDLVLDNIAVHSIGQDGQDVHGVLIEQTGTLSITNSKVYNISSGTSGGMTAVGIHIRNTDIIFAKSDTEEQHIVISNNELFNIASDGDPEGAKGIHISWAENVLLDNNKIYTSMADKHMFNGPLIGMWLDGLGGSNNTVSNNTITGTVIGVFSFATPYISMEDNTILSVFGVYSISNSEGILKKSGLPHSRMSDIDMPTINMPAINPSKSNKAIDVGNWNFSGNQVGEDSGESLSVFFGIIAVYNPMENNEFKSNQPMMVSISKNSFRNSFIGAIFINEGQAQIDIFENSFTGNYEGMLAVNMPDEEVSLNIFKNEFIGNEFIGLAVENHPPANAWIYENRFQENGIGIGVYSSDFTSISINNNKIIDNVEFGIDADMMTNDVNKSTQAPLNATCNWWGTINPMVIEGMVQGSVETYPYLLSEVTDRHDEGRYHCGGQLALLPLSNHVVLLSMMLMAGFALFMLRRRSCTL